MSIIDNSAEMLAYIRGAETVWGDIEELDLGRSFDAVLLASTLINFQVVRTHAALLATCRRHVGPGGAGADRAAQSRYLRNDAARAGSERKPASAIWIRSVRRDGRLAHIILRSEAPDWVWTQSYTCELIDDAQIVESLTTAGLRLIRWLDPPRRWAWPELA